MTSEINLPDFVEVEIGTYCNRTCSWCPNGHSMRGRTKNVMRPIIWAKILSDLSQLSYKGWLAFHNYNEPLADPSVAIKVAEARTALPKAKLTIYTNGDYLTADLLDCLSKAGLNEIKVTLYPSGGSEEADPSFEPIKAMLARFNLHEGNLSSHRERLEISTNIGAMLVRVALPLVWNFSNRASFISSSNLVQPERTERKVPCFLPMKSAAIDWLGNVKLCCQIYDVTLPQYESYFIGNLLSNSFEDIWYSKRMNVLRTAVARAHFEDSLWACKLCNLI